jgi:N-methylhydantoinase B
MPGSTTSRWPAWSCREDRALDAITLEVWWSRLVAIADEAATSLLRTAFSTIIRESNDYTVVVMNTSGQTIAECHAGIPGFAALMSVLTRQLLARFPADSWRDGDIVITNDPWIATGHLPDIAMVTPVFHNGALVGFTGTAAHVPDIGGTPDMGVTDLMSEGLLISPLHLQREGKRNEEIIALLLSNVRLSGQVWGDLEAQMAANDICRRRAVEFLDDTGQDDTADRAMRRAINAIPDGVYRSATDADGVPGQPTRIECAVAVCGDHIVIDYAGSSPQVPCATNCTLNYATAYSVYPLKILVDPFTRSNHGQYRSVTVTAPAGSIVNPVFPAPVLARHLTGHLLCCAVYRALAGVLPDRVIADSGGSPALRVQFSGRDAAGEPFAWLLFASAGMGASAQHDGLPTTAFPTLVGRCGDARGRRRSHRGPGHGRARHHHRRRRRRQPQSHAAHGRRPPGVGSDRAQQGIRCRRHRDARGRVLRGHQGGCRGRRLLCLQAGPGSHRRRCPVAGGRRGDRRAGRRRSHDSCRRPPDRRSRRPRGPVLEAGDGPTARVLGHHPARESRQGAPP